MALDKPEGQGCGNCYYCLSIIGKEIVEEGGIFKPQKTSDILSHHCHRNPPFHTLNGDMEWHGGLHITIKSSLYTNVSKEHWCGEWKSRSGEQK